MFSVTADSLRNYLTAGSLLPLVIALVLIKFVVNTAVRIVLVLVALALGTLVFTQRAQIDECVDKATVSTSGASVSCSILGFDLDVQI